MSQLAFVVSREQDWYLREFVETLRYELDQHDMPSSLHTDGFPEPTPGMVYVLVSPGDYLALEGEAVLPSEEVLRRTIFLCAEPPGRERPDDELKLLRRAGAVFNIHVRTVGELRRLGIPARHLRPGYSRFRDRFDPGAERQIDVMFLGAASRRRTRELHRCARVLARHNCLLQLADGSFTNPTGSSSFLAESKWDLLPRTKVVLNIHQTERSSLEWLRVLDAVHAGAVVVTEHSSEILPLVAGEHLLVASAESLPVVLEAALWDEARLDRLRSGAHERIRGWLPFALSVSVFRAAAVELVGRPLAASNARPTSHSGRARLDRWTPPSQRDDRESRAIRGAVKDVTLEVGELRRGLGRLEAIVRSGPSAGRSTELIHESPAWQARKRPGVTVVTALHNRTGPVRSTLDSLVGSRHLDYELVVVHDGSNEESCDVTRDWMEQHPQVPALLVGSHLGRGVGDARNTAVQFARSPYCLILDPGNEVYPRCLDVIIATLDSSVDAAFAYPILEVFGATEAFVANGGDYLLNFFGWEPRRLRISNYVNGITMIRTDLLRELGGFACDPGLAGWEDYDLWCRAAERGFWGQLVPQILGRYLASPSSQAWTRTLSRDAPPVELIAHAPRLMAGVHPSS